MSGPSPLDPAECPEARHLPALVQGDLPPEMAQSLRRHVRTCATCGPELRQLERALEAFRDAPHPRASVDLSEGVLSQLRERGLVGGPDPRAPGWAFAGMLAASLFLFLLVRFAPEDPAPVARLGSLTPEDLAARRSAATRWLAASQEEDGSWNAARWGGDPRFDVGVTSLSLLALVRGADEDADRDRALDRGVRHLLRLQGASGRIGGGGAGQIYNHAPATLVLLEVLAKRRWERLRPAARRAVAYVVSLQHEGGGWGYGDADEGPANAVISAFPLKVLLEAEAIGLEVAAARARAQDFFSGLRDAGGRLGYRRPGDHPYGTETLAALGDLERRWRRAPPEGTSPDPRPADHLGLYFAAAALEPSEPLPRHLVLGLERGQVRVGPLRGSFSPRDAWARDGGRVYSTSLALLAMEQAARHPPLTHAARTPEETR